MVSSGDVELAAQESGPRGERAVVLVHGLIATRDHVLGRSTTLQRHGFRVIGYDARGHGRSTAPASPDAYGYDVLVEDLVAVMDAFAVDRAVVVGTSMGCHTALRLALDEPRRVEAVAAVTPAYDPDRHPEEAAVLRADLLAAALRRGDREAFFDTFGVPRASATRSAAFRQAIELQLAQHRDLRAVADALEVVTRAQPFGGLSELARVGAPALVVGTRDELDPQHPRAVAERYAAALPRGRFVSEPPGRMPLSWRGGALSRLVLELAGEAA